MDKHWRICSSCNWEATWMRPISRVNTPICRKPNASSSMVMEGSACLAVYAWTTVHCLSPGLSRTSWQMSFTTRNYTVLTSRNRSHHGHHCHRRSPRFYQDTVRCLTVAQRRSRRMWETLKDGGKLPRPRMLIMRGTLRVHEVGHRSQPTQQNLDHMDRIVTLA